MGKRMGGVSMFGKLDRRVRQRHVGRVARFLARGIALVTALILLTLPLAPAAAASKGTSVTIETQKPFGPSPGTFSASGAITDSGTFVNSSFVFSGVGAPTFTIVHAKQVFDGALGTFTLTANIKETVTADPNVLTDEGTWAIVDGTGAYKDLHGRQGEITGTADDNTNVISRTYTGDVHFN